MERTEEDKIVQAGFKVILGGVEYSIAPLVIRDSRDWKQKILNLIIPFFSSTAVTSDTPSDFAEALTSVLLTTPEKLEDLFFEYAKDLNRDEIEAVATDAELSKAISEVVAFAFPLAQNAPEILTRLFPKETKRKR